MKNAFSIDVEDYFHVAAFKHVIRRSSWDGYPSRVVSNTERLLETLAVHDVNATFFILGWVAERYPGLVRKIDAAGHEVACHGYSHQNIYEQNQRIFATETRRAKAIIENEIGKPIDGYRAASFSITSASMWALDVLIEAGFRYDSSIAPVWHDMYGIPDAAREPTVIAAPSGATIAELPMSTMNLFGLRVPASGGGYFRLYPYWFTQFVIRSLNCSGRAANFYMHPWEIDVDQPRIANVGWKSNFRHYNNLDKVESRLHRLLTNFEFGTCREILEDAGVLKSIAIQRKAS